MSSFIRQLNKYDFHKVKPSGDGDSTSPNGNVSLLGICSLSELESKPWPFAFFSVVGRVS